ncbi:TetR/AcrR family transcriptional regulator [Mesorhizobium mediterraneum]|uniref:TetR/AcrR family transcriptional regulator n=1 Tax=Mesorhizobium mediterraneum TaxID=43617 RepID=UPI001AEEC114|nr:TetR/AcrR family transcriptional regulator [Mesorhizobium mediterraneum]
MRVALELMTEKGFLSTGIEEVLSRSEVPRGSFYYYFPSKEAFGLEAIDAYDAFFANKIEKFLGNQRRSTIERIVAFMDDAEHGMSKYEFRRGCLVGNLGQEMGALPGSFRTKLVAVLQGWERRFAVCIADGQLRNEISDHLDPERLARLFWTGWEGAVLRAKLESNPQPLHIFGDAFLEILKAR